MSSIWTVRRSVSDAKLGGVCGGVAEQWGVDPVLVRVGAVLLALSGGIGVVLYLAAWLTIPAVGSDRTHLDDVLPQARRWPRSVKILIVVIACVIGASVLAPVLPFGFGSALVLAAIWYFGYYKNRSRSTRPDGSSRASVPFDPSAPGQVGANPHVGGDDTLPQYDYFTFTGPRTAFTQAAQSWQDRMREYQRSSAPVTTPTVSGRAAFDPRAEAATHQAFLASPDPVGLYAAAPARPKSSGATSMSNSMTNSMSNAVRPRASRPARRLRLLALVVLGLTMSGLGIASAYGVHIGLTTYLAVALLVAGLTLVAAAWTGRARGILPVAIVLAVATSVSALGGTAGGSNVGLSQISYHSSETMPASRELASGSLTVNLSDLQVTGSREFTAHVGQGSLVVIAPPQTRVVVDADVEDGFLKIPGDKGEWGSDLTETLPYTGTDPTGPVLQVHASVDQGMLEVRR